jgi:hypothetical protein
MGATGLVWISKGMKWLETLATKGALIASA